ncbi:hypothetical protein RI129_007825 [Pyrocoelia pectoralis]|uniref:Uncharacterized protein n=1 Tax=Pyrocoelia pectoralis TaxID=417401 RepID=A0AAN7V8X8_9COLE
MVMGQFVTTYRKDYLWPYVRVIGNNHQDLIAVNEQSWSRQGPMGPLMDPKLYPARVGRSPEVDTMRFNQPNVFLKKLQDKYPYIYEYPSAPYDELLRTAGMEGLAPCAEPVKLPGDPCRPNQKPIAFRPATISKMQGGAESSGEGKPCGGGLSGVTPGLTEYQDGVSKVGQVIIREKLHYPKKK